MIIPTALRRLTGNPQRILWGYLLFIALAELLTSFPPVAGFGLLLHAIILVALLLHSILERDEQVRRLTLALVLAPLIRLLSLSLPLARFPQATWHPIISIPLLIAAWMIARQLRIPRREMGLQLGNPLLQFMLIGGGITLGALEYAILSSSSPLVGTGLLPAPTWSTVGLTALSLFVFTGFTEEFIFRGLLQSLALPVLRRWGLIYVSLLFGALHITYLSFADFVFVTVVGLIFAYIVMWSGSIFGVTLAHGLTNVTLFVFLPYLSQHATGPIATAIYWSIWIGTGLWLLAFGTLMWRADSEGRLLLRDQATYGEEGGVAALSRSRAWQRASERLAGLGLVPRIQRTRAWQHLESRGVVARVQRLPWSMLTPRVTTAFVIGGFFGILGSAGLLLAFGNGGGSPGTVAVVPTTTIAADASTPTAQTGTPTAPAVAAVVSTPTAAAPNPTSAPTTPAASTAVATVQPTETAAPLPTAVLAVSLPWPESIPAGLRYTPQDSWPFRFIGLQQQDQPFLIFRDDDRWMVLRDQPRGGHPVPASASRAPVDLDGTQATLITYADGGQQLIWEREGRALQLSGRGVSGDELATTAQSLVTLDPAAFEARLKETTGDQKPGPALLWPSTLAEGMLFQPLETVLEPQPEFDTASTVEGYVLVFSGQNGTARMQVGGGTIQAPPITGDEEPVQWGQLQGRLITDEQTQVLIVTTDAQARLPHFDVLQDGKPALLPPVQQGPVFIAADNVNRDDFERIVEGLLPLSPAEFVPRARGLDTTSLTYMWPATLARGYTVDLETVTFGWDDFLLQGGRPYFSMTARSGDDEITIKGGRNSDGAALVIPEGENVEQFFPTIRGQTATAARSADGSVVVWSEDGAYYSISSPTLDVDTVASIAENLQRVDTDGFYAYLR